MTSIIDCPTLRLQADAGGLPSESRPLVGGKYLLDKLIGEGGMGSVWRARNVMLDLPVAIKFLLPDLRGQETSARFLMEARLAARLQHPSVVRVFDYGVTLDGEAYIVMELLEGESLWDLLETSGPLEPNQAVRLLLPVIDGLCAAHDAGIVHRDLKPENIFLARSGSHVQPKILDFGIAKLHGDEAASRLTGDGAVLGSPAYMAPEQARGLDDVDQRADVWAICVVLYELIAGVPAFSEKNHYAVLYAVIESEPTPLEAPHCATLWPIVKRGLAKQRQQRYGSMHELAGELTRWLTDQEAPGERSSLTLGSICAQPRACAGETHLPNSARAGGFVQRLLARSPSQQHRVLALAACASFAVSGVVLLLSRPAHEPRANAVSAASVEPASASAAPEVTLIEPWSSLAPPSAVVATARPGVLISQSLPAQERPTSNAARVVQPSAAGGETLAPRSTTVSTPDKRFARPVTTRALGLKDPF